MPSQERIQRQATKHETETEELPAPAPAADLSATDELLDEIDKALEGLEESLALSYVQVGGE
jgi:hypothetical protein